MTQHTPGPWSIQPIGDETECNILGAYRELIATVSDNDARLIAAAPELLALIQRLSSAWVDSEMPRNEWENRAGWMAHEARALLARIDGYRS